MELGVFVIQATWAAFLGTPFVAPLLAWLAARGKPNTRRWVLSALAAYLTVFCGCLIARIDFSLYRANVVACSIAWLAFGVLAVSCFRIKPRKIGIPIGLLASSPLLLGLIFGTGMPLLTMDTIPTHIESLAPATECWVTPFGNATTSSSGFTVEIKRSHPLLPMFQRALPSTHYESPTLSASGLCQDAYAQAKAKNDLPVFEAVKQRSTE